MNRVWIGLAALLVSTRLMAGSVEVKTNLPSMVEADGQLRFEYGPEKVILPGGLQPFLFVTTNGTLVVQSQSSNPPVATKRIHYPYMMDTIVSRDNGTTWTPLPRPANENGVNLEGGAVQCADGEILALDTYVTPAKDHGFGVGQLYTSKDDWHTLTGPVDVTFQLPGVNFYASKDDGGHPHDAVRLHRNILEMPNGNLFTTIYGNLDGDNIPSTYMPKMMKSRLIVVRSTDHGHTWQLVSTVTLDPPVGTEGFGEPTLVRISQGDHPGRLLCFMRTGRDMYETHSDDEGATWSVAEPRIMGGLDVKRTELWADMFRHYTRNKKPLDETNPDELRGAVVDPNLTELRSGLLVATFGVRVPQKACWQHWEHPWNGNYLAVSRDHGATWSNVIRLTSGVPTTHYMGVVETKTDNRLYVVYDIGFWRYAVRETRGRLIDIHVK